MNLLENYKSIMNDEKIFIAIDVETTGLDPYQDKVIEIGAVKYQGNKIVEEFSELIDPGIYISSNAVKIHGINNETIKGKPDFSFLALRLIDFLSDSTLLAHNASFDISFLNEELKKAGFDEIQNPVVDTLAMAKASFKGRKSYSLQNLARDFNINTGTAHRASDDARTCLDLFLLCNKELNPEGQMSLL